MVKDEDRVDLFQRTLVSLRYEHDGVVEMGTFFHKLFVNAHSGRRCLIRGLEHRK